MFVKEELDVGGDLDFSAFCIIIQDFYYY